MPEKIPPTRGAAAIRIFPLGNGHIEELRNLRNHESVRRWFRDDGIIDPVAQREWFERYKNDDSDEMWVAVDGESVIGATALYHIQRDVGLAEFGRLMVHPELGAGRGLGRRLTLYALQQAWHLGLSEVSLVVKSQNIAAYTLYTQIGFTETVRAGSNTKMMIRRPGSHHASTTTELA